MKLSDKELSMLYTAVTVQLRADTPIAYDLEDWRKLEARLTDALGGDGSESTPTLSRWGR